MTNAQINKRLETLDEKITDLISNIEEEIDNIADKIEEIESRAYDRESGENTEAEENKILDLQERQDTLESLKDDLGELEGSFYNLTI